MNVFSIIIYFDPIKKNNSSENTKEEKPKILVETTEVLANDAQQAHTLASRMIPDEYIDRLSEVKVLVRPF